jgi:hypothetical protein
MLTDNSNCSAYSGYEDFIDFQIDPAKLRPPICPIKGCSTRPITISYGKSTKPFCPTHGIRLHSNTFVYWNGEDRKDRARLRNFRVRPDLAQKIALDFVEKAESHCLGYENSEDALTWNVL